VPDLAERALSIEHGFLGMNTCYNNIGSQATQEKHFHWSYVEMQQMYLECASEG